MLRITCVALALCAALVACSDSEAVSPGADASTAAATDAASPVDGAVPAVPNEAGSSTDSGVPTSGVDYYELGANRTTPQLNRCQTGGGGYVISGSNTNRTSLTFYFQTQPAPGTYKVEPLADAGPPPYNFPASATGALVIYASDPQGGPEARYYAQSGTVTVTLEGGKLRAVGSNLPAIDLKSSGAGTIAGQLTCP